jgi:hypothetical protein
MLALCVYVVEYKLYVRSRVQAVCTRSHSAVTHEHAQQQSLAPRLVRNHTGVHYVLQKA